MDWYEKKNVGRRNWTVEMTIIIFIIIILVLVVKHMSFFPLLF